MQIQAKSTLYFWVKQFAKNNQGQWVLTELAGEDAVLQLVVRQD